MAAVTPRVPSSLVGQTRPLRLKVEKVMGCERSVGSWFSLSSSAAPHGQQTPLQAAASHCRQCNSEHSDCVSDEPPSSSYLCWAHVFADRRAQTAKLRCQDDYEVLRKVGRGKYSEASAAVIFVF